MDFDRLRKFVAVADEGTVSRAATVLRITQPALSRQIRDLQDEFGVRLFDRIGRRLVLTSEGSSCSRTAVNYWAMSAHSGTASIPSVWEIPGS
jgi:DNA-binding transcriptional LysR family regulator